MMVKIVILVLLIYERSVYQTETKKNLKLVETVRLIVERIVKIVLKMFENVLLIVEMVRLKLLKIVEIVLKM
jgi:hypothetical protein